MFPQLSANVQQTLTSDTPPKGLTFKYDFQRGDFLLEDGKLIETDDIKVWVEKILRTEKGRYSIYEGTNYGVVLEDLIVGANYPIAFIESEVRREIQEALTQHPDITAVTVRELKREDGKLTVNVEVRTIDQTRNIITIIK